MTTPTPATTATTNPLRLTPNQARVLGTLMEKARTVPDSYPLSLNALLAGCNQKSSRSPVLTLTEADVAEAVDELIALGLARSNSTARVPRFEHNTQRGLGVPEQSAVLLGLLMLRGAQTAAELRLNADRWYRFADASSVEAFLDELQDRPAERGGALVQRLPKAPGSREHRWAHTLCGPVDLAALADGASAASTGAADTPTQVRIARLEAEVAALRTSVARLCAELGLPEPAASQD